MLHPTSLPANLSVLDNFVGIITTDMQPDPCVDPFGPEYIPITSRSYPSCCICYLCPEVSTSDPSNSVSVLASCRCLDMASHPDLPDGFSLHKRPKKTKSSKTNSLEPFQSHDTTSSGRPESIKSSSSGKSTKSGKSLNTQPYMNQSNSLPLPQREWQTASTAFVPRTITTVSAGPAPRTSASPFSWRLQGSSKKKDESAPPLERRRSILQSPKRKPAPLKEPVEPPKEPKREDSLDPAFLAREYPQLSPYAPDTTFESYLGVDFARHHSIRSVSQPNTPSWAARDQKRHDANLQIQPSPPLPRTSKEGREQFDGETELALFAAATSGLSPDQPFGQQPLTRAQPIRQCSDTARRPRQAPPIVSPQSSETPKSLHALTGLAQLPLSASDLNFPRPSNTLTIPSGNIVARPVSGLTAGSPSSWEPPSSWSSIPRKKPVHHPQPTTGATLNIPCRSRPPPWIQDDTSALSVHSERSNDNNDKGIDTSPVSAIEPWRMSGVPPLIGDCNSPEGSAHEESPPDYAQSQQEMQQMRQRESARRAEELARRWNASNRVG